MGKTAGSPSNAFAAFAAVASPSIASSFASCTRFAALVIAICHRHNSFQRRVRANICKAYTTASSVACSLAAGYSHTVGEGLLVYYLIYSLASQVPCQFDAPHFLCSCRRPGTPW